MKRDKSVIRPAMWLLAMICMMTVAAPQAYEAGELGEAVVKGDVDGVNQVEGASAEGESGEANGTDVAGHWTHFGNNSDIRTLYRTGSELWVGTNGGLLLVDLDTGEITKRYIAGPSLAGNSIRSIHEWGGRIYVGGDEGLTRFERDSEGGYTGKDVYGVRDVRNIAFRQDGTAYVSTYGHGVGKVSRSRTRWITRADSLLDNKVFAVSTVGESDIYFATSLGLCAFLDSAWVSFQAGAGLPRGEVRDLVRARSPSDSKDGPTFYVLIAGRGVFRFSGRRGRRILSRQTFDENDVAAIALGADEILWACGRFGGIARYEKGTWIGVGSDDEEITQAFPPATSEQSQRITRGGYMRHLDRI
jgi:hypothetical protein